MVTVLAMMYNAPKKGLGIYPTLLIGGLANIAGAYIIQTHLVAISLVVAMSADLRPALARPWKFNQELAVSSAPPMS